MMYKVTQDALGYGVRRRDGVFVTHGECLPFAEHICKELNDLVIKQKNLQAFLDDFVNIIKEIKRFEDNETMRERKINVAFDMVQNLE